MEWTVSYWKTRQASEGSDVALSTIVRMIREGKKFQELSKDKLPAITPCGVFRGRRMMGGLTQPSGLQFVDIDVKAQEAPLTHKHFRLACESPHSVLVKRSYSGGLHILVNAERWTDARQHIEELTGLVTDPAGGPAENSLCYLSYHPRVHFNPEPARLRTARGEAPTETPQLRTPEGSPITREIEFCEGVLAKRGYQFAEPGRNDFLYRLSLMLRDRRFSMDEVAGALLSWYGFDEIPQLVENAYRYAKNQSPT